MDAMMTGRRLPAGFRMAEKPGRQSPAAEVKYFAALHVLGLADVLGLEPRIVESVGPDGRVELSVAMMMQDVDSEDGMMVLLPIEGTVDEAMREIERLRGVGSGVERVVHRLE